MINPQRKIHSYNNSKNIEMKQKLCSKLRACAEALPVVLLKTTKVCVKRVTEFQVARVTQNRYNHARLYYYIISLVKLASLLYLEYNFFLSKK